MVFFGSTFAEALSLTVWSGVLPATLVLALGHGVRRAFGTHPLAYMVGRAFFVPMLAIASCGATALFLDQAFSATGDLQRVAVVLLALGEADTMSRRDEVVKFFGWERRNRNRGPVTGAEFRTTKLE